MKFIYVPTLYTVIHNPFENLIFNIGNTQTFESLETINIMLFIGR